MDYQPVDTNDPNGSFDEQISLTDNELKQQEETDLFNYPGFEDHDMLKGKQGDVSMSKDKAAIGKAAIWKYLETIPAVIVAIVVVLMVIWYSSFKLGERQPTIFTP